MLSRAPKPVVGQREHFDLGGAEWANGGDANPAHGGSCIHFMRLLLGAACVGLWPPGKESDLVLA